MKYFVLDDRTGLTQVVSWLIAAVVRVTCAYGPLGRAGRLLQILKKK